MPIEIKTRKPVELIKELILKEAPDSDKLPGLYDELFAAVREETKAEAREEVIKEFDKKNREDALKAGGQVPKITVTETGEYKGWNIRRTVAGLKQSQRIGKIARTFDQESLEKQAVLMAELAIEAGLVKSENGKLLTTKAYTEGTAAAGGYLVPSEQRFEILTYVRDQSEIVKRCRHVPMISDEQTVPTELTKVSIGITAEASDATATSGTFGQVTLTAKRHDATTTVTNEMMNDNALPGGILAFLLEQMVEGLSLKMESAILVCPGDPVSGIFIKYGTSVVFGTGSSSFSELLEADIRKLIAGVSARFFPGMEWIMGHGTKWNYVYGLKDSQARPLFIPSMTEIAPDRLWGKGVLTPTNAPDTSAAATAFIVLADLGRGFIVGDRLTQMSLFIDPYSKSKSYQTDVHFFTRWAYANALSNYFAAIKTAA